jgi:hypothetical protein
MELGLEGLDRLGLLLEQLLAVQQGLLAEPAAYSLHRSFSSSLSFILHR